MRDPAVYRITDSFTSTHSITSVTVTSSDDIEVDLNPKRTDYILTGSHIASVRRRRRDNAFHKSCMPQRPFALDSYLPCPVSTVVTNASKLLVTLGHEFILGN